MLFGNFESATFDAGTNVGFNYLTWVATEPAGTNIQFQISTNNDGATWNFVGPDGTALSFYEIGGAIPLNFVSAQHFRFKIFLSSDGTTTPVVEDVTVNFSP